MWEEGLECLTLVDVALDHDAHDGSLAGGNLLAEDSGNLGLVLVVLLRVAVAAVDHQTGWQALGGQLGFSVRNAGRVVVGALLAAAQDHEAVWVADSAHDGHHTGLGDGQEVMGVLDRADRIDGNIQRAVGAVLETNGEGQAGGQLAVDLRFSGAGTDGADGQTVCEELRGDSVEHFASDGHALAGEVDEELARGAQTLVNLEAVVDIRVVDQSLPANGGTGLLQVRAHDNQQLIGVLLLQLQQLVAVLQGHIRVMDRAGPNDHHQTLLLAVGALHNSNGLLTAA